MRAELSEVRPIGPFSYRWPVSVEDFSGGWEYLASFDRRGYHIRHGVGRREVYGRSRVHTVTFINGAPRVEGVETDAYRASHALLSGLRVHGSKRHVREPHEIPAGYEGFEIVSHRDEIDAPFSPRTLALKIGEDDLVAWATHGCLREIEKVRS